jgi:Transposase DDE domain group 1
MIRRSAGLLAAGRRMVARPRRARWAASRQSGSPAEKNFSTLADLSGQWIDKVHAPHPPHGVVLDMDSSVSPTHGEQKMSAWNGHYGCTCYHPLFLFNQFGDLERCALRDGNVHSADGWKDVRKSIIIRYKGKVSRL